MSGDEIQFKGARQAARIAWQSLCPSSDTFAFREIRERLSGVLDAEEVDRFLAAVRGVGPIDATAVADSVTVGMNEELRREQGIYLTPQPLAGALATPTSVVSRDATCLDLSCGGGALLLAAARRQPRLRTVGVEMQLGLAVAAAARLVALRDEQGVECRDRIIVGDGLAEHRELAGLEGSTALVLGNPPYVREKGNRERFQALRARHPHLEEYWGGRMDLQYLFFHRSLDYLVPGGWMAFLTSSYWLTATNARALRRDLGERAQPRVLVDIRGAGVFDDAPGHHTLLSYIRRGDSDGDVLTKAVDSVDQLDAGDIERAVEGKSEGSGWSHVGMDSFTETHWLPFVDAETKSWGEHWADRGVALSDVLLDRQGFVSGADRVHAWNAKRLEEPIERDTPIFLFDESTPDGFGRPHGTVLRPVIRGSSLRPNQVLVHPPDASFCLYVNDEVDGAARAAIEAQFGRFRGILEARREAQTGAMPWYRMHWPRDRSEQTQPKLVVPRRAKQPCFALDISGSCVSSDCTYLLAPDDAEDALGYLSLAMVLLNRPESARYLREFGKTKGDLLEFYSEPLRRLPLPVRQLDGRLELNRDLLGPARADVIEAESRQVMASLG